MLGVRIAAQVDQHRSAQPDRPAILKTYVKEQTTQDEHDGAQRQKDPRYPKAQLARGQRAITRTRVAGVEAGVGDAVEGHSHAPRRHHTQHDQGQLPPMRPVQTLEVSPGHERRHQGKRQGEDRMGQFDHLRPGANARHGRLHDCPDPSPPRAPAGTLPVQRVFKLCARSNRSSSLPTTKSARSSTV